MLYLNGRYSNSDWAIWKIEETEQELLQMLNDKTSCREILAHKSASRRLEKLAVRVLLKIMLGKENPIQYLQSGKPYLENGIQISISHTSSYVAVVLNKNKVVALDIEHYSEKLYKVRNRFVLNTDYISKDYELKQLTLYWCAKEAIYKCIDNPQIDLLNEVVLDKFTPYHNIGKFELSYKQKASILFEAFYICTDSFALVIVQKKSSQKN